MSILNVYVKKEGKTTWIQIVFSLIYTTLTTKIKYQSSLVLSISYNSKIFFMLKRLKVLR